jgi:hypothetical protein
MGLRAVDVSLVLNNERNKGRDTTCAEQRTPVAGGPCGGSAGGAADRQGDRRAAAEATVTDPDECNTKRASFEITFLADMRPVLADKFMRDES